MATSSSSEAVAAARAALRRPAAAEPAAWRTALNDRLAPARAAWRALPLRDRRLVVLAATVLAAFVVWVVAVKPAITTLRQAPAQLDALDAQLQGMQRLAVQTRELRAAPSIGADQAKAALQAASDRLGEKARLTLQADRAVLTLNGVDSEALRSWLAEVRSGARARPLEAQLARDAQGFTGTITLALMTAP